MISLGIVILIFTPIVLFMGLSFFLFTYPRLKKELQEAIDKDTRTNLDEINYIKFNIRLSIMRIVYSTAFLIFIMLSIIYKAF
jgi:hypothetical protein